MAERGNSRGCLAVFIGLAVLAGAWFLWQLALLFGVAKSTADADLEDDLSPTPAGRIWKTEDDPRPTRPTRADRGNPDRGSPTVDLPRPAPDERPDRPPRDVDDGERPVAAMRGGAVWGTILGLPAQFMSAAMISARPLEQRGGRIGREPGGVPEPVTSSVEAPATEGGPAVYSIAGLIPGPYQVCLVLEQGVSQTCSEVMIEEGGNHRVEFGQPDAIVVRGRIVGYVPLPGGDGRGFLVPSGARAGVAPIEVRISPDGSFMAPFLDPGDYVLRSDGGYPITFSIEGDGIQEKTLYAPSAGISGRVERSGSGPLVGITVRAARRTSEARDSRSAMAITDASGAFELQGLPGGTYDLFADSSDGTRGSTDGVEVADGQIVTGITVQMGSGGTMELTIKDAWGGPIDSARVFCVDARGFYFPIVKASGSEVGLYRQADMGAGGYRLVAAAKGVGVAWLGEGAISIEAGQISKQELVFAASGNPICAIVSSGGRPSSGILLVSTGGGLAVPDPSSSFSPQAPGCQIGESGRLCTQPYPVGSYIVTVTRPDGAAQNSAVRLDGGGAVVEVVFDF